MGETYLSYLLSGASSVNILHKMQKRTETLNARVGRVYVVLNGNHDFLLKEKS